MNYVIIGTCGHHHQALEATRNGFCPAPLGVAAGSAGEDAGALSQKTGAKLFGSWRRMLDEVKPDIAVVNPWFCDTAKISIECLKRGIHVFSEKPLAIEMDELVQLKEAHDASSASLGCMLNLNCCSWYRAIENSIAAGDIGEIRMIHGQKSYRMGVRGANYQNRSEYGGTIPWVSVHAVDWVLRLGGRCEWIAASHSRKANRGNGDMETTAAILLQMENGVIGTVDTDFLRPKGSLRHDDDRLRVTGTCGMLEAIDGKVTLETETGRRVLENPPAVNPFERFVNAIGTEEAERLFEAAFEDTRIVLLARQAADEGRIVKA